MISSRAVPRLAALAACILLGASLASQPSQAQRVADSGGNKPVDAGRFNVTVGGRNVGVEDFRIEASGDSLIATAIVSQYHPGAGFTDTLKKKIRFVADAFDYGLRSYQSLQSFRGRVIERGLSVNDTTYTTYRNEGPGGVMNAYALPPGRVFVLDPPVFTNFDAMCMNLGKTAFQTRPVTLLMMTVNIDTVITATATDRGRKTITWAGKPVLARHVTLGDAAATYDLWIASDGRMLRLEHEGSKLRVERVAPPLARRAPRRPATRTGSG